MNDIGDEEAHFIDFCPMHKAAPEMLEAAKAFMTIKQSRANDYWDLDGQPTMKLEELFAAAIARAEKG